MIRALGAEPVVDALDPDSAADAVAEAVPEVTVAAAGRGKPGIYHAADDDPAPVNVRLPEPARALGAKPPGRAAYRPGLVWPGPPASWVAELRST